MNIPYDCPRGRKDCIALANIISDDTTSFFCCGENKDQPKQVEQDIYTTCFKGEFRDEMSHSDKLDLVHQSAVIIQSLAVIQKAVGDDRDWSPWTDLNTTPPPSKRANQ